MALMATPAHWPPRERVVVVESEESKRERMRAAIAQHTLVLGCNDTQPERFPFVEMEMLKVRKYEKKVLDMVQSTQVRTFPSGKP